MALTNIGDILDGFIKDLKKDAELREKKQGAINEAIDQIMHFFDFEKVHRVMEFLDWKLVNDYKVPTVSNLRDIASELLYDAAENECSEMACGFAVDIDKDNFLTFDPVTQKYHCQIRLRFVVESLTGCS